MKKKKKKGSSHQEITGNGLRIFQIGSLDPALEGLSR